ncbi:MAG: DUF1559 domain-containing protein [Pirellulales bacterium]
MPPTRGRRAAFTLIELLIVIVIIGILAGLLLPAISSSRAAARQLRCKNNIKQIALATIAFETTNGAFPPARLEPPLDARPPYDCGGVQPSWLVRIMPFIDRDSDFASWDLNAPYGDHPAEVRNRVVSTYICPERRSHGDAIAPSNSSREYFTMPCGCGAVRQITVHGGAVGDYAANHGDLSPGAVGGPDDFFLGGNGTGIIISSRAKCNGDTPINWVDVIRVADVLDGLSNTALVGELHVTPANLTKQPHNGPLFNGEDLAAFARVGGPGVPLARSPEDSPGAVLGFGSWHREVCMFAMGDGSVRAISNLIDTTTLGYLCNRADSL